MLKNYFTIAIRNLLKYKLYTLINVLSLAFALAICMTALSYMIYELSWEKSHVNYDRIYRVEATYTHVDTAQGYARIMPALGPTLVEEVPGVEQAAVFRHHTQVALKIDDRDYEIETLIFAAPEFFDVFTVDFLTGNPAGSLSEPYSVIISAAAAEQYFPHTDPIGQTVELFKEDTYQITGIFEDLPENTQIYGDFIASYATLAARGADLNSWDRENFTTLTYLLLDGSANPATVKENIPPIIARHLTADIAARYSFALKPLGDIYFTTYFSGNYGEIYPGGEREIIYMLLAIAFFILIQAVANFINLSTARSAERMKEVGVRKTFGAERGQLIKQFLGESMIITAVAMAIAANLFEIFRRGIQSVLTRTGTIDLYSEPLLLLSGLALIIVVGLLAGAYPALYMSRVRPIAVLQSRSRIKSSRSWLRKGLVIFQFTLGILFVLSTVILLRQFNYLSGMDQGFDPENVLVLKFSGEDAADNCRLMKNEVLTQNVVGSAAAGNHALGTAAGSWAYFTTPERRQEDVLVVKSHLVDYDFLSFYGLRVTQGRGFSEKHPEDIGHGILINEAMVRELGLQNPLGYKLYRQEGFYEVVGVVQDFIGTTMNFSYHAETVIRLAPADCDVLTLRLTGNDISGAVARIDRIWNETLPDKEFAYSFLSEDIRAGFREIQDMINVFGVLALVSIGIACLGIFGLVSYTAEQKTREIGIRKVLGASVARIISLLGREFATLIVIANVIAAPLAYLWMNMYLQEFPYRVGLGLGTFAAGGIFALIIALATAGWQSFKAASANPVDSLRHE